jgi:ribosomal protein L29
VLSEDASTPKLDAVEMHACFSQEYSELSDLEKEELVEKHRELKNDQLKFRCLTAQGHVLDMSNAILNLKKIVSPPFPCI